jgi:hypothetical protein
LDEEVARDLRDVEHDARLAEMPLLVPLVPHDAHGPAEIALGLELALEDEADVAQAHVRLHPDLLLRRACGSWGPQAVMSYGERSGSTSPL